MYGWHLKILRVNLTTRKATKEDVNNILNEESNNNETKNNTVNE